MKPWPLYAAVLLMGCSAAVKHKPGTEVVFAPAHCVVVDSFAEPCRPAESGYLCNGVHLSIKPEPACNEFNVQQVLNVRKPQ